MTYNRIPVTLGKYRKVTIDPVNWQYDVVQILVITAENLPEYYIVDFCNEGDDTTIPMTGSSEGVQIPDEFFQDGRAIKGYVVIAEADGSSQTRYEITIPVSSRPSRSDITPKPSEQQQIDNLVAMMNEAVENAADSAEESERQAGISSEYATDSEAWAVGQRGGVDVEDTDETYQNNAKYYAGEADRISRDNATLAESWAVGGTGTRPGEDNDNAKHYSELSAQGAEKSGYAWFDVDDSDGCMYVYISDNLSEDVSFAVDETSGVLEVTYN